MTFISLFIALADKERETIERCAKIAEKEAKSLEIGGPTQASHVAWYIFQNIQALAALPAASQESEG